MAAFRLVTDWFANFGGLLESLLWLSQFSLNRICFYETENYRSEWQEQHVGDHAGGCQQTAEILYDQGKKSNWGYFFHLFESSIVCVTGYASIIIGCLYLVTGLHICIDPPAGDLV